MEYVVLDTDVASLSFKGQLPASWRARLLGRVTAVTFVTVGELSQWAELREWAPSRRAELDRWLASRAVLEYDQEVARSWGRLSARATRRGGRRPANDTWIAACCLVEGMPLATRNVKDHADFAEYDGLRLVTE